MKELMHNHDDQDFIHPFDLAAQLQSRPLQPSQKTFSRRQTLKALGAFGALGFLAACGSNAVTTATTDTTNSGGTTSGGGSTGTCAQIPTETKGPYPLDGSNGSTNALSSLYRSNIIGSDISSTAGVPLMVVLNIQNTNQSCAALSNAAVYIWHCDQYGQYSGYSSSQNGSHYGKTFCRGIVVTDSNGQASFTTLFPGWYAGRITHVHMAIYLNNNLSSSPKVSQFGFPQSITQAVYNTSPYSTHGQNTSVTSFSQDNIFSDGTTYQIATVTGSASSGLVATLNVGVPA